MPILNIAAYRFVSIDDHDSLATSIKALCVRLELKGTVLVSPVAGKVAYADLAQWTLESALPFTLQVQLHKVIWGNQRGV